MAELDAATYLRMGLEHHLAGRSAEAEKIYREILERLPNQADSLHLLGVLLAQQGKYDEALPMLEKAILLWPSAAEFHRHLGDTLGLMGQLEKALASYRTALQIDPRDANSWYGAARVLAGLNRNAEAVEHLQKFLALVPDHANALADLGIILTRMNRLDDAVNVLKRALAVNPELGDAWTALSDAYRRALRGEEGLEPARRGAELTPNDPWAQTAYGNVLQILARFEEACEKYRAALALNPQNFDAINNLGLTLAKMGEADEAMKLFDEAQARWPQSDDLRANRSLVLLTLGRWEEGFREYEVRFKLLAFSGVNLPAELRWHGEDVSGKTILLNSEQGLGDTIQFVRYVPLIAERGARVVLFAPRELHPIVGTVKGVAELHGTGGVAPPFDFWAPLASLPLIFKTTTESVPNEVPYLYADDQKVRAWRERLAVVEGFKVGFAWAGSPQHMNDRARSCRLEDFGPVARVPGVKLVSLQKGPAAAALALAPTEMNVLAIGDELTDFGDTAAAVAALDLLVSVDTSPIHVAGAIGQKVWLLLARGPDWRWMSKGETTPWYPTMRLFRQRELGKWGPVMQRVAEALAAEVEKRG